MKSVVIILISLLSIFASAETIKGDVFVTVNKDEGGFIQIDGEAAQLICDHLVVKQPIVHYDCLDADTLIMYLDGQYNGTNALLNGRLLEFETF